MRVENKFLLWKSVQHRALVVAGFELTLPSGSESRGLGGRSRSNSSARPAWRWGPST